MIRPEVWLIPSKRKRRMPQGWTERSRPLPLTWRIGSNSADSEATSRPSTPPADASQTALPSPPVPVTPAAPENAACGLALTTKNLSIRWRTRRLQRPLRSIFRKGHEVPRCRSPRASWVHCRFRCACNRTQVVQFYPRSFKPILIPWLQLQWLVPL